MNHLKQTRLLWEVQCLEKELRQLEQDQDNKTKTLSDETRALKQLLIKQQQVLKTRKAEFEQLQGELNLLQDKVTQAEGICDLDQRELYQDNTNHKEVEALFHKGEVDLATYRRLQEEYLVLAEKKEQMHRQLGKSLRIFRQNKELYYKLNEQLQTTELAHQALVAEKAQALMEKRQQVAEEWWSLYEELAKKFPLTAVSQVKKSVCSACYLGLSFDNLRQSLKVDAPIYCEHCGRLLYFTTEELQRV